jgi:phosphate acyltransferase
MSKVTIALDAMSGDKGMDIVIPAAFDSLKDHANLHLVLVGDQSLIEEYLQKNKCPKSERLTIYHASQIVEMGEPPSKALRNKKDSSIRVAVNLVKEGVAQACVSAGNTGALMATARFVLKTLPGIDRPAIISALPTKKENGCVRVLDLGANIDSSVAMLFQFAIMGSILTSAVDGIEKPKVALLNVGEEEIKGNERVKEAARLLLETEEINYIGYIEGNDIYSGKADVIVCDGFVGNIALKASEGIADFMGQLIKKAFRRNFFAKLAGTLAIFVLRPLVKQMNPEVYNGASFVGLRGIVVKSHGNTTVKGFEQAINRAISEVEHNVPELIKHEVEELLLI